MSKGYRLIILPRVYKTLKKIPPLDQKRVLVAIVSLTSNPRPSGCKKLTDFVGGYRIRVGNYRII